jgi:sugar transferase (PEP-CTERM/EpsH1 system associated)
MNILFLCSRMPFPPVGGDRVRSFQLLRHLSQRHTITLVTFVENNEQIKAAGAYRGLYHRLVTVPLSRAQSYFNTMRGLASSEPLQAHYYQAPRMHAVLKAEFIRNHYDVALVHMIRMCPYLDDIPVRKVVDLCDALALYHQRATKISRGLNLSSFIHRVEAKRLGAYETEAIRKSDVTLFISPVDAAYYRDAGVIEKTAIVCNGVDLSTFQYSAEPRDSRHLVYLGNMKTFQNTDAAVYFATAIFPLIKASQPDAVFTIVGNQPSKHVQALHDGKNIIVTGRVDSVIPHLAKAAVFVAPMRAFAGVQNKILESLAVGTPVVATPVGAEGLHPDMLTVAHSAHDFAAATLELMRNPALRSERALLGRKYVENFYSFETTFAGLDEILAGSQS